MRIGIDLGGTKIEAVALGEGGNLLARLRIETPPNSYSRIIAAIASLVREIEKELQQTGTVGVGTPGALSPATGLVKNSNSTGLNGHALDHDLSNALRREVRVCNDANCFALSEATDGAGIGATVVFGVILGTGVGGGVVVRGKILTGPNSIAGEWGHNPLPWPRGNELPGPPCYCGKQGCIETFLSGPGLARDFKAQTGGDLDPPAIVHSARGGNPAANMALERYEDRLARALAHIINILDPDVIVLGGGMSNIERIYDNVPRQWAPYVFSDTIVTKLCPPMHGDASGVRGAAWLWPA